MDRGCPHGRVRSFQFIEFIFGLRKFYSENGQNRVMANETLKILHYGTSYVSDVHTMESTVFQRSISYYVNGLYGLRQLPFKNESNRMMAIGPMDF